MDLDALATAQEEEAEALASLATAKRTLGKAREKQQVRQSRGHYRQQQDQRDQTNRRQERKCGSGPHWASQCPGKQGKLGENKGKTIAHTTYTEFALAVQKRACSQKRALEWCFPINEILGGTGRSGTHECAASRFYLCFLGPRKVDMVHLCKWTKDNRAREKSRAK